MHNFRCRWIILIAVLIGGITVAAGVFGMLTDLDTVFFLLIAFSVLALILVAFYSFRKEAFCVDLRCLTYAAFTAFAASVLGVVIDVLAILETPLLFLSVAASVVVFWSAVRLFRILIHRASGG